MKIPLTHKYRPKQISDIACQPILTRIINNAIILNRLSSAYLFSGMRGVGKTSTARVIARTINCINNNIIDNSVFSCGKCKNCISYISGSHPDIIEIDAASNTGVDNIRNIIEDAIYKPILGKYKVYIIDEVHMLSKSAFNAFLKILEEPPLSTIFILATTEPSKVLPTISSRCQRFELDRVDIKHMADYLSSICTLEDLQYTDDALIAIAKNSEGSIRDAISLLDKASAFIGLEKKINEELILKITGSAAFSNYTDLMHNILTNNTKQALYLVTQLYSSNISTVTVLHSLLEIIANICKSKMIDGYSKDMPFTDLYHDLLDAAKQYNVPTITVCWQILFNRSQQMQNSFVNGLLHIEMIIIELICALKIGQGNYIFNDQELNNHPKSNAQHVSEGQNYSTPSQHGSILDNKYLLKILGILQQCKLYEVYYFVMNDAQVLDADESSISLLVEFEDKRIINKLSNAINNSLLNIDFKVRIQMANLDKRYNLTNQLIDSCKLSSEWQIIKNHFPGASIKDILYHKDSIGPN